MSTIDYDTKHATKLQAETASDVNAEETDECIHEFGKMLSLAVSYSATTGGTATLTGSPPNLIFAKIINR
jgi:solute carrier family 13 (sodium-dependent dicarboxylate transporter), member 2/3/5